MVGAEFYIDLCTDIDFASAAAKTELELIQKIDDSIKILEELKFEGMVARAYLFKGLLWNRIYN